MLSFHTPTHCCWTVLLWLAAATSIPHTAPLPASHPCAHSALTRQLCPGDKVRRSKGPTAAAPRQLLDCSLAASSTRDPARSTLHLPPPPFLLCWRPLPSGLHFLPLQLLSPPGSLPDCLLAPGDLTTLPLRACFLIFTESCSSPSCPLAPRSELCAASSHWRPWELIWPGSPPLFMCYPFRKRR